MVLKKLCSCCKTEDNYKLNEFEVWRQDKTEVVLLCDKCFKEANNSIVKYRKMKERYGMARVLFGNKAVLEMKGMIDIW